MRTSRDSKGAKEGNYRARQIELKQRRDFVEKLAVDWSLRRGRIVVREMK